ncbi:hypothetical protein [Solidesulfovibrio sp.]
MTPVCRPDRLWAGLALAWLLAAVSAAACDWPTPARISEQRYRMALLLANAVDKTFLPSSVAVGDDTDGPYRRLAEDFSARFGPRFNRAALEAVHAQALAGLAASRVLIVLFTLAATAVIWRLLAIIRTALARPAGQS